MLCPKLYLKFIFLVLLQTVENASFKDKVVLVTGSSRGIGAAIARKFAGAGADVVLNYRKEGGSSEKKALELRDEIEKMGRRALVIRADISKKDEVKALVSGAVEGMGRLDVLVLNAARAPFKPIERLLERELRQLVETNYMGNIFCIQEALPALAESKGNIVFISSLGSKFFNPSYPLGSMKAAMEAVVRDCAESLRPRGIRVNGVCGGIVRTDALKTLRQFWEELEQIPEEVFIEPEEVADAVLFLCSPEARGILGQCIVLDKGLSLSLFRSPIKK
jgi:NAD(P)-dependent dehydrogenase (short-subunit alcohol dehydrogenase family)